MTFGAPAGRGNDFWVQSDRVADGFVFIAPRDCKFLGAREVHDVVGGASAAVRPRKITADSQAPGAAAGATVIELTTATIDLTATVNIVQEPTTVSSDPTAVYFDEGDRLAENITGTIGSYSGVREYHFLAL